MQLTEDQRIKLTDSSLVFLRAIGDIYGSDRAMEMWNQLADTVDQDLKGWTFEAMLLGRMGAQIVVTDLMSSVVNKVGIIKTIRAYDRRKLGLKEAKDMLDGLMESAKSIHLEVTHDKVHLAANELRLLGCRGIGI